MENTRKPLKILAISDTHNKHNQLTIPECDILIHAGDATGLGRESEVRNFAKWLNKQPTKHIIFVAGNHEVYFEKSLPMSRMWVTEECPKAHVLIHESLEIEGIKIFGSPYTPYFLNWAFNVDRGPDIRRLWDQIPDDTQLLITHGPPYGILDVVFFPDFVTPKERVGCMDLLNRINELKDLKMHFFGHLHGSNGEMEVDGKKFYNVASCDDLYIISNEVRMVEW